MSAIAKRVADLPPENGRQENDPTKDEVIAELRQLVADLRDAAQDGRMLAARYSELLTKCVDEYCVEFELRADRALKRLEEVSK